MIGVNQLCGKPQLRKFTIDLLLTYTAVHEMLSECILVVRKVYCLLFLSEFSQYCCIITRLVGIKMGKPQVIDIDFTRLDSLTNLKSLC